MKSSKFLIWIKYSFQLIKFRYAQFNVLVAMLLEQFIFIIVNLTVYLFYI